MFYRSLGKGHFLNVQGGEGGIQDFLGNLDAEDFVATDGKIAVVFAPDICRAPAA